MDAFAALAARVDELSQTCARLSLENAELRDRVSRLRAGTGASAKRPCGPPASPVLATGGAGLIPAQVGPASQREQRAGPGDGKVSRRSIGKALGAAAAGMLGAAALVETGAGPAAASDGNNITAGNTTTAESATTVQFDGSSSPGMIFLVNDTNFGGGSSSHPAALGGWAGGDVANGVYGFTEVEGADGVVGQVGFSNITGNGVHGLAAGSNVVAVFAENSAGTAVSATSGSTGADATAIVGTITTTSPGKLSAAVRGVNDGTGGNGIGVWGSQPGAGWGVYGTSARGVGVNASGATGVRASGSGSGGRGGVFSGSAAQVQLTPGAQSTHPQSGKRGDLYADSTGRLWFCTTSGSTATWHQIA